jgi:AcrR family transcriptional regulator
VRDQPFHHGNLRAVLLDHAEQTLREQGIGQLSLRELARQAGVSHGAPRSHFIDKRALLDALAERGFTRLTDEITAAVAGSPDDFPAAIRAATTAYVRFAVSDAALLELMFAAKSADPPDGVLAAADRFFTVLGDLVDAGVASGRLLGDGSYETKLLFAATMQGIAALISTRRISAEQGDALITHAVGLITPFPY